MYHATEWEGFCPSMSVKLFLFWFFVFAKAYSIDGAKTFSSPFPATAPDRRWSRDPIHLVRHDVAGPCVTASDTSTAVRQQYTRTQLLAVSPARLTAYNVDRLRSLGLGRCLPRKRQRRRSKQTSAGPPLLKVLSLNCQSVRGIASELNDTLTSEKVDIAVLTETWLKAEGDEAFITALTSDNYKYIPFPRPAGNGYGGIGFVIRKDLFRFASAKRLDFTSMEAAELKLTVGKISTTFVCVYRLHPKKENSVTFPKFFDEFSGLLSKYAGNKNDFHIHGDFNLHFNKPNNCNVSRILTLLADHNLCQQVDKPTQRCGNTLDWTVVRSEDSLLNFVFVKEFPGLSDHFGVFSLLRLQPPAPLTRHVTSRNIKAIEQDAFSVQVRNMVQGVGDGAVSNLVEAYNKGLGKILDEHAPLVSRRVRDRPSAPWMTEGVREARRKRRRAERKWRKTHLTVHKQIYVHAMQSSRSVSILARKDYYFNKMKDCKSSKQLFNVSDSLLGRNRSTCLPTDTAKSDLPQRFCDYFSDKIRTLRSDLDQRSPVTPTFQEYDGPLFAAFEPVSEKEIYDLILSMPTKSCALDPLPTQLAKTCLQDLLPLITNIINSSLCTGIVPSQFKQAVVTPLLKKKGLDYNVLKNYRPVSNLPFLSKVLEKVVLKQLQKHILDNNLFEMFQSAYRKDHSAETAVLSVMNSLLLESDAHKVSVMALLDLSAAFDTLDHSVLLHRLERTYGFRDTVLDWFSSYVCDRAQCVIIDGVKSSPSPLLFGVPQGSVLGPVLFTLYSQPLSDVMSRNDCQYHKYADDTEVSSSSVPLDFSRVISKVQTCVHDISSWMDSNKLKLNPDKTEVIKVGVPSCLRQIKDSSIELENSSIDFQQSVKYLGVTLDSTLTMKDHISSVCRACFLELRRIASIRQYLSREAVKKLVSASILSRIDYCNATFIGITDEQLSRLQRIQNAAARLILRKHKRDHVTPMFRELHWLPVRARVQYKVAVLAYRHFDGCLAPCLSVTLTTRNFARGLRSSSEKQLVRPKSNLLTAGGRAFSIAAPMMWNKLPVSLRNSPSLSTFKSHLKTYLFKEYVG